MADIPEALRLALATRLAGIPAESLRASVDRLMSAYRSGTSPASPIIASDIDVAAYAAYRMPATYAAVRAVLGQVPIAPASLVDAGGGTGAAAWAAVDAYATLRDVTVLDQVDAALRFGADLALGSTVPALLNAAWTPASLPAEVPAADLVTISYVLGELPESRRATLIDAVAAAGRVVAIIEPGTPAGYARILDARTGLIARGWRVLAPCPHQRACPLLPGKDWCHFGARVNRSALHRRIKDAELSYEDEKFAYVVAASPAIEPPEVAAGRVLRRPVQRKGMVTLRLCEADGTAADRIVSKRNAAAYRSARDTSWGDAFPAER